MFKNDFPKNTPEYDRIKSEALKIIEERHNKTLRKINILR